MGLIHYSSDLSEVGLDEAGRGCLAGPVVAAAVVLPKSFAHPLLDDSKKLTEKERVMLKPIIETAALGWAVGVVSNEEIDEINILNASFKAMHLALDKLSIKMDILLVDGNRFKKYKDQKHECIIKGDGKIISIAAASILAKTHRDDLMHGLDKIHPEYLWGKNKGYPTKDHREAIKKFGVSSFHRKSFQLLNTQLEMF